MLKAFKESHIDAYLHILACFLIAMIGHFDQNQLGRKAFISAYTSQSITGRNQGSSSNQNLEAGTEAETVEEIFTGLFSMASSV